MKYNKKILSILDEALSPDGKNIDNDLFDKLFNEFGEDLAVFTEPDPKDEDTYEMWNESTLKHQVFDYWIDSRPKNARPFPGNDLPWILACYSAADPSVNKSILKILKN